MVIITAAIRKGSCHPDLSARYPLNGGATMPPMGQSMLMIPKTVA
jgi:hypothetical protein